MVSNLKKLDMSGFGSDMVDLAMYRHRHWVAAKHVLKYLRGTFAYGLKYTSSGEYCFMVMLTMIGLVALWTQKVLQATVLAWILL